MNIISNSCIYAILCRDHWKCQYGNPFCWNYIDTENMYNLIKNFDNINWFNYELVKDKDWNFSIIIDNKVKVNYVHYKFNKNEKELTKHGSNLSNNHIWEYIVEEYEKRVKRMLEKKRKTYFYSWNYA